MNFVFFDSSDNCGGIENLLIEMSNYLANLDNKVFFITYYNDTIYHKVLTNKPNVKIININYRRDIQYLNKKEIANIKRLCLTNLEGSNKNNEKWYVITPYFLNFQFAMAIFGDDNRFKLMHLWGHPEDWKNTLRISGNGGMTKRIIKNNKYYYQKKLIKILYEKNADFYGGRVVPVFNDWYYGLEIEPKAIYTLPIKSIDEALVNYNINTKKREFNIIWCGRFDYWKNEAIIHISEVLEKLSQLYTDIVINYDLIGSGEKNNTNYVKNSINTNKVHVRYLGMVKSDELSKILSKYDLGIGMGLSVKKMGQVGVPAIVIDSVDKEHIDWLKADWLFNTKEGDAGDGYYFHIAGKGIEGRKSLYELLDEVFKQPLLLNDYSKKCMCYVKENYSEERQIQQIVNCVINSKFSGINYPIYHRNMILRIIYRSYQKYKLVKRKLK
ncbi:hypothetical protein KPL47_17730 [Clostridium estertheticum]|uniref:hypothetical protein n=1 Tax=Clostridium estertheticum TaxID=238834 RepID=UPI001C0D427C|nr:hypothetical protein [Clostridium estertheticum]MBU3178171.1 hypothetical protein [Clostridium estertheticum]